MKNEKMIMVSVCIVAPLFAVIQAQPFGFGELSGGTGRTINCDTTGILEGPAGANITWTIPLSARDTSQFNSMSVLAANTPYASSFPTATDALTNDGAPKGYAYYRMANDSLILLGFADSLKTIKYADPLLVALSKLTLGASFTDAYGYRDSTSISGVTIVSKLDGTRTVAFDGTGMLVLPWKTFSHALRFKTITSQTDSTWISMVLTSVVKTDITEFSWADTTLPRNYGFSITRSATGSTINTTMSTTVAYTEPVSTSALPSAAHSSTVASVNVTILPFDNVVTVNMGPAARIGRVLFTVYDMSGKTAAAAALRAGVSGVVSGRLNTHLKGGVYCCSLRDDSRLLWQGKILVR